MAEQRPGPGSADAQRYPIAPLIRFTLLILYGALALPLPLLAPTELKPLLWAALPLGLLPLGAMLSEEVVLDGEGIKVGYPAWCRWLLRRGWHLGWTEIGGLVPITTSQGGSVYYVQSLQGSHFLLPQRVDRFPDFLERFQQASGLNTVRIGRITPSWTYWTLASLSGLLLAGETWALIRAPLALVLGN
jgi:hypothetical protein